jgi:two-component system response regulator
VVLTTSRAPADVRRAYDLNANSFLRKPLELPEYIDLMSAVRAWWLERVELP